MTAGGAGGLHTQELIISPPLTKQEQFKLLDAVSDSVWAHATHIHMQRFSAWRRGAERVLGASLSQYAHTRHNDMHLENNQSHNGKQTKAR